MAKYLDKWKDLFPDTVGGTTRPSEAVSDQEEFNTDGFPQFIAQDPVNYALQNAFLKQFLSNDAWLWVKQKQANQALDDHKVDTQAHAKGISGNAGSATKLANARTIKLSGAVTADAASFDGTADATINVKTLDASKLKGTTSVSTTGNAATATKLATARTIALSGDATGSTTFDGSGNATINATVNESAHAATATQVVATAPVGGGLDVIHAIMASDDAMRIRVYGDANNGALEIATGDDGTEPIYARQYKNSAIDKFTTVARTAAILDTNGNTSFPGTVTAASFTGPLNGNATSATTATALKIVTYRPADANTQYGDGNMRHYLASASMTKNKPPTGDGHIINLAWDNNGGYDAQLYVNNTTGRLNMRGQTAGKWSNWLIGLDSGNFNDYAPTKTGSGASGTWGINITGNAATATTANALNGIINREPATNNHAIIPGANARDYCEFHEIGAVWNFIKTSNEGSTTVASIRSDGFHGNVVGNASTATNADKLDGYHASDLFRHLGGNQTPVITDIFDRAGTIDMTTMSAADKATHKANINKSQNVTQNLWNTELGIYAYGGDTDMVSPYNHGTLKLTQSWKNFDKLMILFTDDHASYQRIRVFNVWEFNYCMNNYHSFDIFADNNAYWYVYSMVKHGTDAGFKASTETLLSCREQNSGLIGIYGIKF